MSPSNASCERKIRDLLKRDSYIRYVIDSLESINNQKLGEGMFRCVSVSALKKPHDPDDLFQAPENHTPLAGYLWKDGNLGKKGQIFVNADRFDPSDHKQNDELRSTVLHELIHAYDDARAYIDPQNCLHQACSEIRAAKLSGECSWSAEWRKGNLDTMTGGLKCVTRHATRSVSQNPFCKGSIAERSVQGMMTKCYRDNEPFVFPPYSGKHEYNA